MNIKDELMIDSKICVALNELFEDFELKKIEIIFLGRRKL
jgi:hypothetical protein